MIGAGVEHMGHVPFSVGAETQERYGHAVHARAPGSPQIVGQGLGAEMIADQWEIPRSELDAIGLRSHQLAQRATEEGRFQREILPDRR